MSDLMKWMYAHYIRSYIESQPKDDGETMWFDLLENELGPLQRESLEAVTAFFAVQGFRLGLKTGMALAGDLETIPRRPEGPTSRPPPSPGVPARTMVPPAVARSHPGGRDGGPYH